MYAATVGHRTGTMSVGIRVCELGAEADGRGKGGTTSETMRMMKEVNDSSQLASRPIQPAPSPPCEYFKKGKRTPATQFRYPRPYRFGRSHTYKKETRKKRTINCCVFLSKLQALRAARSRGASPTAFASCHHRCLTSQQNILLDKTRSMTKQRLDSDPRTHTHRIRGRSQALSRNAHPAI